MNLLRNVFLFGAIALVFNCCSESDEVTKPEIPQGQTPIRLSSSVNLLRSGSQNTQIVSGQKVGFFLNETNETDYDNNNVELTADGEGNFTHSTMNYPEEGSTFEFTAYHPYSITSLSDGNIVFSVNTDQSVKADYLNSDLLYSSKTGVEKSMNVVQMPFAHKLSKLTFVIIKGDGADISDLSKIEILDVLSAVSMDITTGDLSNASGMPTTISAYGVEGGEEDVETLSGSAAIIVPQTIESGKKLLRISFDETTYSYATEEAIAFEGGKEYEFQIEISAQRIKVSSSIGEWISGGSISGEGVHE